MPDLFHLSCLNDYAKSLPETTAPPGYRCPKCKVCRSMDNKWKRTQLSSMVGQKFPTRWHILKGILDLHSPIICIYILESIIYFGHFVQWDLPPPSLQEALFPPLNMVSPIADRLRQVLYPFSWAREGLGAQTVSNPGVCLPASKPSSMTWCYCI